MVTLFIDGHLGCFPAFALRLLSSVSWKVVIHTDFHEFLQSFGSDYINYKFYFLGSLSLKKSLYTVVNFYGCLCNIWGSYLPWFFMFSSCKHFYLHLIFLLFLSFFPSFRSPLFSNISYFKEIVTTARLQLAVCKLRMNQCAYIYIYLWGKSNR